MFDSNLGTSQERWLYILSRLETSGVDIYIYIYISKNWDK